MQLKPYQWLNRQFWIWGLLAGSVLWQDAAAQAIIQVRVNRAEVLQNSDCDGFLSGDSDFVMEYRATGVPLAYTNNNPSTCALIGQGTNIVYRNGHNGPWNLTPGGNPGNFNPSNGLFFNHQCVCVPNSITIFWEGYENDNVCDFDLGGLLREGNVSETFSIPVPGAPGSSGAVVRTLSVGGGCPQTYRIEFEVIRASWAVSINYMPDNICDAVQLPVGVTQTYGWCPGATLEPGEPHTGSVSARGSRWLYFVAPGNGATEITTDFGGTEFGTYFHLYHAADGAGCTAGLHPVTGAGIKSKFDFLSNTEFADNGGFLNLGSKADLTLDACDPVPPFSYQKLHPGQVYYLQITADNNNEGGYIQVRVNNLGGSPAPNVEDIPCTAPLSSNIGTAVISSAANSAPTRTLNFACAYDGGNTFGETGRFQVGNNPATFHAYKYDHPASGNSTMNESIWTRFVAPNSGRIVYETDYQSALYGESAALFGFDPRFAPGVPNDYLCSNLSVLAAVDGGLSGIFGGAVESAIIRQSCLEPGYQYYPMSDPSDNLTPLSTQSIRTWIYDPSVADPANNPPGNDILCLAMANSLYQVPVQPYDSILPFNAVAGSNVRACLERLAGEPVSAPLPANRADQTVWHYFVCPPSGVVDIRLRAYIGLNTLNYAIYPLLNGTSCYGGLAPATFTTDGTRTSPAITPVAQGSTDFNGTTFSLCCLVPGTIYAIQLDGGSPGDEGQYIIEFIREVEVYAGNSQYVTEFGDTTTYLAADTSFICYGDSIFPSVMLNGLGVSTTRIPLCLSVGFVLHNTLPIPDPIANVGFTYIDSVRTASPVAFVNDGSGNGSFGNPQFNQVYYVSALADETSTWGQLLCPSASMENGAPVVFLAPIVTTSTYDPNNCVLTFSATGGLPGYNNGFLFTYYITNSAGDTLSAGTVANGQVISYAIPAADIYTITLFDGGRCTAVIVINANPCLDPCINHPVVIQPSPIDSTVYTCLPGGDSALVTILITGGDGSINGTPYTVTVSGSTAPGANGTFVVAAAGGAGTPFTFTVRDGDTWQVIVSDVFACADTAAHTFTYDLTNCPDYCSINPMFLSYTYECLPTGQALINVTLGGGAPAIDGSPYYVSTSGSTVFGQTFNNAQLPGVVGGTAGFSMIVNNGNSWQIVVIDNNLCADTLSDTYNFDLTDCPNLCNLLPVNILPDPITSSVYSCLPNGTATVTLFFTGGDAVLNGTPYTVTISGSSVPGANGVFAAGLGSFQFQVSDNDAWQVILTDANMCSDTASGVFTFDIINCPTICNLLPIGATPPVYTCDPNGAAIATINISGGMPSFDGSNYLVTVTGSSVGGNVTNAPVAGTIGGASSFDFLVNDGDSWQVVIVDSEGCTFTLNGTFIWNATNCSNICAVLQPTAINGGGAILYDCNGSGGATATLTVTGGAPALGGTVNSYTALVTVNGTTTSYVIPSNGNFGSLVVNLQNGDQWSALVFDALHCDTAQVALTTFNAVNAVATTTATGELLIGEVTTIDASQSTGNNLTYLWTPTEGSIAGVTDFTAAITTIQPTVTTIYTVQVTDDEGCTDTASVEVVVGRCIPLHAGFTPNNDGVNDLWLIPCLDLFLNRVEVYNRWGQMVFQRDNYTSANAWDGANSGIPLPDATYYYVITVEFPNLPKPVLYKGTVTIIR